MIDHTRIKKVLSPGFAPDIDNGTPVSGHTVTTRSDMPESRVNGAGQVGKEAEDNMSSGEEQAVMGYDKQIEALKATAANFAPETPEQKKKRERQERAKRIISAVADGISALSNLNFTTQYAPNSFNPRNTQLGKVNERIEALKSERKADEDRYTNFMLRLGDVQNAKARTLRDLKAQQEAQRIAREKAKREEEEHGWKALLQDDKRREQKGKADKAEQDAIASQHEAQNKPEELKLKNATEKARASSYRAASANSIASARAHDRNNPEEFSAWDEQGNEHKFRTKEAADRFAKQHGTWQEEEITSTTNTTEKDDSGAESTKKSKTTKQGGRPMKPNREDNTPPSRRKNNDNTPPSRR